ncbi:MAG: lytic murein transglycosylase, partial [Pseudomonas sp.]|nr:lytic murein transglycosylase [Pseudomonas sp.]
MHSLRSWAARTLIGVGIAGALGSGAQALAADYDGSPQVAEFVEEMTRDYGFASEQLVSLFAEVERKQAILDAISRPAEKVKPWKEYRPIFITDKRIAQGVEFWSKHQAALEKAEAEYGVPPQFIVAIIGVETFYGGNTGSWRVMDALSTLAFDYPPRAPFFRKELREFLLLTREE